MDNAKSHQYHNGAERRNEVFQLSSKGNAMQITSFLARIDDVNLAVHFRRPRTGRMPIVSAWHAQSRFEYPHPGK
jgi:hypothetical protein